MKPFVTERTLKPWPYLVAAIGVIVLALIAARGFLHTTAQDSTSPDAPVAAQAMLTVGTCEAPGEARHALDGRGGVSGGDPVGSAAAALVSYSVSQIAAGLDEFLAEPHAIVIRDGDNSATGWLACGDIGGFVDDDGLVVGMRPAQGSGLAGIAILWNDGDAVEVELYLADEVFAAAELAAGA